VFPSALKMEAVFPSETLLSTYKSTRLFYPEYQVFIIVVDDRQYRRITIIGSKFATEVVNSVALLKWSHNQACKVM
jgi:hypothetical protein